MEASMSRSSYSADPTTCNCRSTCQRRQCPCKASDMHCTQLCTCKTRSKKRKCMNLPPPDSSASSTSDAGSGADVSPTEAVQPNSDERALKDETEIQNFVKALPRERLEIVAAELLRRQPDSLIDFLSDTSQAEHDPVPSAENPQWCKCGKCRPMLTEVENKCCKYGKQLCLTDTDAFTDICLNANVLGVNMRVREDELVNVEDRSNANYRHYSYRNYIYWRFGRLGHGNRMVIPACCVRKIRVRFPAPGGVYTGYIAGENLPV